MTVENLLLTSYQPSGVAGAFLLYPTLTGKNPQTAIYCIPKELQTTPTTLFDLITDCTSGSITTVQFYFFGSTFSDYSKILNEIQHLNLKPPYNNNSFITWIDEPSKISDEIKNAVQLPLNIKTRQFGEGSITLPDLHATPISPSLPSVVINHGIYVTPSNLKKHFTIGSGPLGYTLAITSESDSVSITLGQNGSRLLTLNNPNSSSSFQVFGIPLAAESSKNYAPGRICLLNNATLDVADQEAAPRFNYSLQLNQEDVLGDVGHLQSSVLKYPLFKAPNVLNGKEGKLYFNPLAPGNGYLEVTVNSQPSLQSAFRTVHGDYVKLSPILKRGQGLPPESGTFHFAFNCALDGWGYLTPTGSYAMTIDGLATSGKLLCGLSGTEVVEFQNADQIKFTPGESGHVSVSPEAGSKGLKYPNVAFKLQTTKPVQYTTAWASIVPSGSNAKSPYYSEGDRSPFFKYKSVQGADDKELSYHELSLKNLSGGNNVLFPMVPYGAVVQASSGFGQFAKYVNAFEFQCLNPTRQKQIEALGSSNQLPSDTGPVYTLTPQGYQATFVGDKWTGISIAKVPTVKSKVPPHKQQSVVITQINVEFGSAAGLATDPQIPTPVQQAFLTNQQFLVITANVNSNLDNCTFTVEMDQWSFTLDSMPRHTTPGEYTNVFIFKSGNTTIKQMAKRPELWTQYGEFNDTTTDPTGNFLSGWLVNYLEEAETLYDGGAGVTSLKEFCTEIIDNRNWNGFLALKVPIDMQVDTLPVDIRALLTDISGTVYAHHLGNEVNHVQPVPQGPYNLNSPFFGLVHYVDPKYGSYAKRPPTYIPGVSGPDFKVLTLEVVFQKAAMTHFANKSMLVLDEFFGDKVQQYNPGGSESGVNNIILIGSYHLIDKVSSYTFSTAQGTVSNFYLSSNAFNCNKITSASMSVTQASQTSPYVAIFALRGSFRFLNDKTFDLLSYESLLYHGLSMIVTIQKGIKNKYDLNTSSLTLELNETRAVKAGQQAGFGLNFVRLGSLAAQFPMKLKSFVQATGNATPADQGYRLLETSTPRGISFTNPAKGKPWYALEFDVDLGGQGSLASSGVISATMMLVWEPGGSGNVKASPQFKLSGPGGVSLNFDLEGVLKFGAKDIVLNKTSNMPELFYLIFESIALTVLDLSFPPAGTTNVVLMGKPATAGEVVKPTLSWFGGYVKQTAGGGN